MIPYFLLVVIPAIMCCVAERQRKIIISRNSTFVKEHNIALPVFFVLLYLLLACRANTIGRDLPNYQVMYDYYIGVSWRDLIAEFFNISGQFLFRSISKLIAHFTTNFNVYKAIIALITIVPIGITYSKDRENSFVKIILFLNMPTFIFLFSGLRQSMAIAMGASLCYMFVKKKRLIPFLVACLLAVLLHHSAFMLLLLYPAYHLKISKTKLILLLPCMGLFIVFNRQVFKIASTVLAGFSPKYFGEITSTGAYGSFFLYIAFSVLAFVVPNDIELDCETYALRNYLLLATVIQSFAALNPLVMRLNYYFIIFIPIVIAKILSPKFAKNQDITAFTKYGLVLFFLFYYVYNVYISSITGISALDTYPYVPLWDSL